MAGRSGVEFITNSPPRHPMSRRGCAERLSVVVVARYKKTVFKV
jgi:hypothetical protein